MFYRVSNAVIAPSLIQDLGLNAETLVFLEVPFFILLPYSKFLWTHARPNRSTHHYIILFLDWSVRSLSLALGSSFTAVVLGRILIGVGMSSVLMALSKFSSFNSHPTGLLPLQASSFPLEHWGIFWLLLH